MKTSISIVIAAVFTLQYPSSLLAQVRDKPQDGQRPAAADPCQARPGIDHGAQPHEHAQDLSRCRGVLKPPAGMDDAIEKKPPRLGDTPVIPPNQLPPQPKSQ